MALVFVDTNAFLGFYAYSSDDLAQLEKLVAEVKSGNIELFITEQILDEFNRNREAKIADTLKRFTESAGIDNFPRLIQHYSEFPDLKKNVEAYAALKKQIMDKLKADIEARTLPADKIFDEIVGASTVRVSSPEIIEAAKLRMAKGNPPGKNNSLGDAINWELLLADGSGQDLHIVTQDKDYLSPVASTRVSNFLSDEWEAKCGGAISLYANLRGLFKVVAPEIKLSSATTAPTANSATTNPFGASAISDPVEEAVSYLELSGSFATTHAAIRQIPIESLSAEQAARLLRAAVVNDQIAWICGDGDVSLFYKKLYANWKSQLEEDVADRFKELYLS